MVTSILSVGSLPPSIYQRGTLPDSLKASELMSETFQYFKSDLFVERPLTFLFDFLKINITPFEKANPSHRGRVFRSDNI